MAYNGTTEVASGLKQMGTGNYKLVNAQDVYYSDDKSAKQAIDEKIGSQEAAGQYIPKPAVSPDGQEGQLLKTNGDGTTEWTNQGTPTSEQVGAAVSAWLNNHPEATTTVQDGSITEAKLASALATKVTKIAENTQEVTDLKSAIQAEVFRATKEIAASDFNSYLANGAYLVNSGSLANRPDTTEQGTLLVFAYNTTGGYGYDQIYITNSSWRMFYRAYVGGAWKDWREVVRKNDLADFSGTVFIQGSTATGDFNSYVSNGAYFVNSAMTHAPSGVTNGLLCVFTNDKLGGYGTTQIFIPQNTNYKPVYRYKWNSTWSDWSELYSGVAEVVFPANQNVLAPDNFTLTGFINTTDGTTFTSNSNYMCTNDFIDVPFGTQNIYAVFPQTENNDRICAFLYYDSHGNYTGSYSGRFNGYNYKTAPLSGQIDVAKIKFWANKTTVSGGSNEVCISFSSVQSFPHYEGVRKVSNAALETPSIYLPLAGKTIVNFGDSIFGNKRDPYSVSDALAEITGANVYNMGFGGCDMAARSSSDWDAFSMYRLAYAIANNDFTVQDAVDIDNVTGMPAYFKKSLALLKTIDFDNVDYITIAFGTNDFTGNIVIDNESDPDDTTKFCGALRYSLEQIMAAFPHIKIFVCGQTWRFWLGAGNVFEDDSDTHENGNGDKLTDFVAATKSVSDEYHVPFIDNYNIGINKINRDYYFPTGDGTHQNYLGAKLIAEHIKHELY